MILVASQRGGPKALAAHLLNAKDNDHVTVQELRGFVASDLAGAMLEIAAIARGTRCTQPLFSLSFNPPKEADASLGAIMAAVERAENTLGLTGQPRAIVIHEKNARRHAHVVWSRIDSQEMRAINMPFFKTRLTALSKELFLEHGWELPEGHRTNGWKNPLNFSLAEWQQAKRHDLDPREIKQVFRNAWERSDGLSSFRQALEEHGYYLAKGDRRSVVAIDLHGEVYSVPRWTGLKTKDVEARLGKGEGLREVAAVQADLKTRITQRLRDHMKEDRNNRRSELAPLQEQLKVLVLRQRAERVQLEQKQEQRWREEARMRAERFRRGLGVIVDVLSGRLFKLRQQNEREAFQGWMRDRMQREELYRAQMKEREGIQSQIARMQQRHREERRHFRERIAMVLDAQKETASDVVPRTRHVLRHGTLGAKRCLETFRRVLSPGPR